jgi:uncharacterized protein
VIWLFFHCGRANDNTAAGIWQAVSDEKLERVRAMLRSMGRVAVAYSGGVDSALLVKLAKDVLGDDAVAMMNVSPIMSADDAECAVRTARAMGVEPVIVRSDPLSDPGFRTNPRDRCYRCKRLVFTSILAEARARGIDAVVDGSHADDVDEDRPGRRALNELGIRSPLQEAGLSKEEIRESSRRLSVPSADRPSSPCLATRIPFGREITEEALRMVSEAEQALKDRGFMNVRVRHHGTVARIEVPRDDLNALVDRCDEVVEELRRLGFIYVAADLRGLRSGSMSEAPDEE